MKSIQLGKINEISYQIKTERRQAMKTKRLFKVRFVSLIALCYMIITLASCTSEDIVQNGTNTESNNNLTTFVAGEPETRTSMEYNTGAFYWEEGDKIYVKDDDGIWQRSSNSPTGKVAAFKFKVPGKFNNSTTYKVYYPGKNGSNNQVTIAAEQTQKEPNSTVHFGISGDCGTAVASNQGNGSFAFKLEHQAAILVFQPYTTNTLLQGCHITKIEVTSDNDIADTYTLSTTTGELTGSGTGNKIVLTTMNKDYGSTTYTKGFPLTNTVPSRTVNGAYMLIKPGTHKLKVQYWLKCDSPDGDEDHEVEGTITKNLSSFVYDKNTYYDMNSNLDVMNYPGNPYYLWDAKLDVWSGYEWDSANPLQYTLSKYHPHSVSILPQDHNDNRYFNEEFGYQGGPTAISASHSAKDCPNVNEMRWYVEKGDPHYDTELWTCMGRLNSGGLWLKKQNVIASENSKPNTEALKEKAPDGIDYTRTIAIAYKEFSNIPINGRPDNLGDYFYLPAFGYYDYHGDLSSFPASFPECRFWSSTPIPDDPANTYKFYDAYTLYFGKGRYNTFRIGVGGNISSYIYRLFKPSAEDEYRPNGL